MRTENEAMSSLFNRHNQPIWLRVLNALTVLALCLFVFAYQAKLSSWPSFALIGFSVIAALINFIIHFRDILMRQSARSEPEDAKNEKAKTEEDKTEEAQGKSEAKEAKEAEELENDKETAKAP
ncbi:MAG: hypothetical protein N4A65_02890 [Cohaesibacter sp.]|jgi:flagellar biosynthesis/type III secretory pathway M-ring protein FliF/YscJ|nr:hypothetical protein [Cohaesibacter sp.]